MQLPEKFLQTPRTKQLDCYIRRNYSPYGYKRDKSILYDPEWTPEESRSRYRWVENVSDGMRVAGKAQEVGGLDHTGWFLDDDDCCGETADGMVYQLPSRNGKPQFVPGVADPYNPDCAFLDFHSVSDDKEDAAYDADEMARVYAEAEREYRRKDRAQQRIADIDEKVTQLYSDFRRIARELRKACDQIKGVPVVKELVKERWEETKAAIRDLKKERTQLEEAL